MEPKYVAVKGRRGVDIRCCAYARGPIMAAHDAKNRAEPKDHLCDHEDNQHFDCKQVWYETS